MFDWVVIADYVDFLLSPDLSLPHRDHREGTWCFRHAGEREVALVAGARMQIEIDSGTSGFAEGSDRWYRERAELRGELQRALGSSAVPDGPPAEGAKGVELVPIIIALAGGSAIPALARCLEMWLKTRPRDWSFVLTRTEGGKEQTVRIAAHNLPGEAVESLARLLGDDADHKTAS